MAELVDARDLKSLGSCNCASSILAPGTKDFKGLQLFSCDPFFVQFFRVCNSCVIVSGKVLLFFSSVRLLFCIFFRVRPLQIEYVFRFGDYIAPPSARFYALRFVAPWAGQPLPGQDGLWLYVARYAAQPVSDQDRLLLPRF